MRTPTRSRYYLQCSLAEMSRPGRTSGSGTSSGCGSTTKRRVARHRSVDRKEHCAVAQLRRRADAVRPAVSRRRRRPHRAADRRQGPQSRRQRCAVFVARAGRALPGQIGCRSRALFGARAAAGVEGRALLLVDDDAAASLSRRSDFEQKMQLAELDYLFRSKPRRQRSPRTMSDCRIRASPP